MQVLVTLFCVTTIAALALAPVIQATEPQAAVVGAAMQGNRDAVRELLKDGADVNSAQGDGMTALHWAASRDDVELANVLLYAGANLRATTRIGGYTPLLVASQGGNAAVLELLLNAGSNPNARTTNGTTPLMFVAQNGNAVAVNALIAKGADVNAQETVKGGTALTFAAAYGRADVIRELIMHGADPTVATKVIDLAVFERDEQERLARLRPQARAAARGTEPIMSPGINRPFTFTELVGYWGGLAPLHLAARQGEFAAAKALIEAGADVNQRTAGDHATAMLIATINGHFDLAKYLLDQGGDPNLAQGNGVTPLYAVLNCRWAAKTFYPQPRAHEQQQISYLDLMIALLDHGANPNVRLARKVWYSQYDQDQSGVDEAGATPFWRAAYAADVDAMKLLVARGADPSIPTLKTPPPPADAGVDVADMSELPPLPVGGPGVPPLLAAAGVGYGEGYAANHHRFAPGGMLAAVKYLVEELQADVNATDHDGNTAIHDAAARGDNDMILYLVSKGADSKRVNREGKTTVDMANGPVQRIQPFPETIKLLESMGVKNNHKCVSC